MATEFERRYPPDRCDHCATRQNVVVLISIVNRLGEETSSNARVWRIYRDRANDADQDVVDGWNKTLDVLLIFVRAAILEAQLLILSQAGLFSAVSTAFLVEV